MTPAEPAAATGLRGALEAIRDAHTPDPADPHGMGWDDKGTYVRKDAVCRICGTSDEYAVDWPCDTHEQARAALTATPEAPFVPDPNEKIIPTLDVERLAAALIPVTRGLWGIDDMTAWRKRTAAAIAAAYDAEPAGLWAQEDDMCPNCVTPWKCNGPHLAATPEES